ncbi:hypothetical protein BH10PSE7_BH10PSE7_31360 [soil metagenome]
MKTRITIAKNDNVLYTLESDIDNPKEVFGIAFEDFCVKNPGLGNLDGMVVSFDKV